MAMLRRLDGPVCAVRSGYVYDQANFMPRASDWSTQNMRMEADSRAEMSRSRRLQREAREECEVMHQAEQAAVTAERHAQLAHEAELKQSFACELEKRRQLKGCQDARIQQAATSSVDMRSLQHRCLNEQASAEAALQELRDRVAQVEQRQSEAAERDAEKLARLHIEEKAKSQDAVRRAAGKDLLCSLSAQAAARRGAQRADREAEQHEDRIRADQVAARMRDEDVQRFASERQAQAKLHSVLDELVDKRKCQLYEETMSGLAQVQEAHDFTDKKRAFAEKLATEQWLAEESRQRVLHDLERALRTNQLQARASEEICDAVRHEEALLKQRQDEELRLRKGLQHKMARVQAWQESIAALEERRITAQNEEDRERQELLRQLGEQERLEQLSEQRRRMKQLAHSRDVECLLRDRREHREKERCKELEEILARKRADENEALVIQDERCRLLEAYGLYKTGVQLEHLLHSVQRSKNRGNDGDAH